MIFRVYFHEFAPESVVIIKVKYHKVGHFCMVQSFVVFMDRSAAVKIKTMKFQSLASAHYGVLSVGVV